jgi:hypothetical protein
MTARTCVTAAGLRSSMAASIAKQRSCVSWLGLASAATSPAWAGRANATRAKVDWLPPPHIAWFDPKTGRPTPIFAKAMHELFENRLGGIRGRTVAEVETSVTQTQAEVVAATTYAQNVASYAQGIAATASATAEVAQSNSLTGATSIPEAPEPPAPPGTHTV